MDRNESPNPSPRKLKFEQLRADYELFLQTFEKPTQIYRYLRTRHMLSPLFLHRTLSYMQINRRKRAKKNTCKVDNLLEKAESANNLDSSMSDEKEEDCSDGKKYLNMTFSGFFLGPENGEELLQSSDQKKHGNLKEELVDVEVQLIKVLGKRKKDINAFDSIDLGTCKTGWNPRTQLLPPSSNFTLSVPVPRLQVNNKHVKTHILSIQIILPAGRTKPSLKGRRRRKDELCPIEVNGNDSQDQNGEPPAKRLKRNLSQDSCANEGDKLTTDKMYYAQLILFDRHKNCLLDNGDYELLLHPGSGDENDESKANKRNEWEAGFSDKLGPYEMFAFGPTIRFQLHWQNEPIYPLDEQPLAVVSDILQASARNNETLEQKRVFYQFIYNNSTRQQTEARDDFYCPWCSINCFQLYSLLKHLKTCHSRFIFVYTPLSKGVRIDVCLNDNYTSAWTCNGKPTGFSVKCVNVPTRKRTFTEVIVKRAATLGRDLSEFTEPDIDDLEGVKPFVKGHDRLYYHSSTSQPFGPQDVDEDSEDEVLPIWLKEKTNFMIDEFSDVNEGEKELMKLWNYHIITKEYIADFQMPVACRTFVESFGKEVLSKNLKRNFLVHLINLCDFGLIGTPTLTSTMGYLNSVQLT